MRLMASLTVLLLLACSPEPPNLEPTVEAVVKATIDAAYPATPTSTPVPIATATPAGGPAPTATATPAGAPAPTATATPAGGPAPTATATPAGGPAPIATATPVGGPAPTPALSGRDPYSDGQPPRFLWHYPPSPRFLTARSISRESVVLEWEPVHGAAGYDVLYYPYSEALTPEELANTEDHPLFNSAFASTGDMFTSETSQEIADLDCEQTYLFEVRALGGGVYIDTVYPARNDYGPPSRVIISPCDTGPARSGTHTGLCPDGGEDCLSWSPHWPPFQAVYSYFLPVSNTLDCADGTYYESRLQIKYIDYRGTFNHRTTVIADLNWAHPDLFCSGGGVALDGVGSYEEQKGLIHTSYDAIDVRARVERQEVLSGWLGDLTSNLYYLEGTYGRDIPSILIMMGIDPAEGVQRPEGAPEDFEGICYRNVCASGDAALRFGDDLVTNDRFRIPLALKDVSRVGDSIKVHQLWIDADREVE